MGAGLGNVEEYIPRLRRRSANAHGSVTTVDALHLEESPLLVAFVGEAHESVSARLSSGGVRHDLRGLAGWETSLEEGYENELVDLRAEVANEDRVLRSPLVTMSKSALKESIFGFLV